MKQFIEGIWNAPASDVWNVINILLGVWAIGTLIGLIIGGYILWKVLKDL